VTRVFWARSAVEQLALVRRLELRKRIYRAVQGLGIYPLRGRVPPEVARFPDLELPANLREVVFPRLVRVFYRYDDRKARVYVLGMSFRGQEVGEDWLQRLLEE
jgi:plasmid stabilization system protein ParE